MKTEHRKAQVWSGILGFLAALGSTGAFATGMRMEEVSLGLLTAVFLLGAILFAVMLGFKGFAAVPALLAAVGIWLWFKGPLSLSVEALIYQCSYLYDLGYGCGTFRWSDAAPDQLDPTLAVCAIGLLVMLCVSWTVARGKNSWAAVGLTFLPLVPCLLLTDTIPKLFFLFLQLLTVLLLTLTGFVRRKSLPQGNALTVLVLLPAVLALGALFFCMPQESYTGDIAAQQLEDWVVSLFADVEEPEKPGPTLPPVPVLPNRDRVNLSNVGPMWKWEIPVMEVTATQSGTLYLRERAYDTYDGTGWEEDENEGELPFFNTEGAVQTANIRTYNVHDYLYLPYGVRWIDSSAVSAQDAIRRSIKNADGKKDYTVGYIPVDISDPSLQHILKMMAGERVNVFNGQIYSSKKPPARYLTLPEDTRAKAQAILTREIPNLSEMSVLKQAQAICDYVKSTAPYSLSTPRMPQDADFALWFLEESDTGYCVHFATAAAVLLRAAGIPSRYVTGYLADAQADQTVTVMEKSAHAWVEVNIGGRWIMLEPTPADGVEETLGTQPPETTEPSTEGETTAPTEPENTTQPQASTTPSSVPPASGEPSDTSPIGGSDSPTVPKEPFRLPKWAKVLLWICLGISAVIGQWKLRVFLRRRRWQTGSPNAQALARWQDVLRYARLLKKDPDPNLYALALKAKFSQYTLTKDELHAFRFALDSGRRDVWNQKTHIRLIATLVLALH